MENSTFNILILWEGYTILRFSSLFLIIHRSIDRLKIYNANYLLPGLGLDINYQVLIKSEVSYG